MRLSRVLLGAGLGVVLLLVGGLHTPAPERCHCAVLTFSHPGCQAVVGGWVC